MNWDFRAAFGFAGYTKYILLEKESFDYQACNSKCKNKEMW